jgi:hypothetical protein
MLNYLILGQDTFLACSGFGVFLHILRNSWEFLWTHILIFVDLWCTALSLRSALVIWVTGCGWQGPLARRIVLLLIRRIVILSTKNLIFSTNQNSQYIFLKMVWIYPPNCRITKTINNFLFFSPIHLEFGRHFEIWCLATFFLFFSSSKSKKMFIDLQ